MINLPNITEASKSLFIAYAEDAGNWGGNPLVGGNVGDAPADKGNLTQLKKAGLVITEIEEGNAWLFFTTLGKAYATQLGIEI